MNFWDVNCCLALLLQHLQFEQYIFTSVVAKVMINFILFIVSQVWQI